MNIIFEKLRKGQLSNAVIYTVLAVLCLTVYSHTLSFGVTNSDDDILITKNLAFLQHLPNLSTVFTTDAFYRQQSIDLYRPLQSASFIIDAQWGINPVFTAHLTNLLLHILCCMAVFYLLELLRFRKRIALLGAAVYAVHYLFMTAVAWLPARGDLLLALFTFLTLITFIELLETASLRYYLLHFLFFSLAIFSKESAVVLPILLAVYLWAYAKTALLTRRVVLLPVYYATVQTAYFVLKSASVTLYKGDTGILPFMKNIRVFPEMVARFYLPVNISTLPAYKLSATLTGVLLLIGLAAVHLYARRKMDRQVLFAGAWVFLFIIPGMTYFPAFYNFAFEHVDHRAYVTCFGLLLVNLNLVQRFELDRLKYFPAAALVVLVYLTAVNVYFSGNYKDPSAFALRAIRTNPDSADAYSIYGTELYLQGRDDEALDNLSQAIRIFSKYTPALHTRARIYRKRGLNREALADLDTIVAFDPAYDADIYTLRAQIKIDQQDYAGAIRDYEVAIKLSPGNKEAVQGLLELQRTVHGNRLLPNVRTAQQFNRQGVEAGERGDFKGAEALFRKALASDPGFYGVNLNLGNALYEQGRGAEACAAWRVAAEHDNSAAGELLREYCKR
jgi:tetratricopeptide (TPR) repeat protein